MEEKRKPNRWWMWVVVVVGLALLVGYPLSFGPAYWGVKRAKHRAAHQAFRTTYYPLLRLASRNGAVAEWADWYLCLGLKQRHSFWFIGDDVVEFP